MNKKFRPKNSKSASTGQSARFSLVAGGAVLLIIAGLAIWWSSSGSGSTSPSQAGDAPRLVVDRTTIDDGSVKFETPVQAAFKLSNIGAQPLQILGEPQVELIEGC
jgi:hypothetical protein